MKFKTSAIILFNLILFSLAIFTGYKIIRFFAFFITAIIGLSFIMVLAAALLLKFNQSIANTIINKGMGTDIILEYNNRTLFIYPFVKLKYIDGTKRELTIFPGKHNYSVLFRPSLKGVYTVGVDKIVITDFFDMFKYTVKIKTNENLYVMPCVRDYNLFEDDGINEHASKETKVNLTENRNVISDLREYKYGDTLNKINWKATAKFNDVIVNNYENQFSPKYFIYIGGATGENIDEELVFDDFSCEIAITIIDKIISANHKLSVLYNGKEDILNSETVKSFDEFRMYLTQRSSEDTYEKDMVTLGNRVLNSADYNKVIFIMKNIPDDTRNITKALRSKNIDFDIYKISKMNDRRLCVFKTNDDGGERNE